MLGNKTSLNLNVVNPVLIRLHCLTLAFQNETYSETARIKKAKQYYKWVMEDIDILDPAENAEQIKSD